MKTPITSYALLALCAFLLAPAGTARAASEAEIDQMLAAVAAYDYDQSRAPLSRFADAVQASLGDSGALRRFEDRLAAFLASGRGTVAARQFACRELGLIGTKSSVPVLAKLLANPETADLARLGLEPIPGGRADDALLQALKKSSGRVRHGLLGSLGERRCEDAVDAAGALLGDADPATAAAAAAMLGRVASSDAAHALDRALAKQPDAAVRVAIADALLAYADRLLREGRQSRAAEAYARFTAAPWPRAIRVAAFTGGVRSAGRQAGARILAALRGDDAALRTAAITLVRELPDEGQVRAVAGGLVSLPPAGQVQLIAALVDRAAPAVRPQLLEACRSEREEVRVAALRALGALGQAADVSLLSHAAAKNEGAEKNAARDSLYRLRDMRTGTTIVEQLSTAPEAEVRVELARAVGERGMTAGKEALKRAAKDPADAVRVEALRSLTKVGAPEDVPDLISLVTGLPGTVERDVGVTLLEVVSRRNPNAAARNAPFLELMTHSPSSERRAIMLSVFGRLGDDALLGAVRGAINDPQEVVRDAATEALATWPTSGALPDLLVLTGSGATPRIRALAVRGLVRIVRADRAKGEAEKVALYREAMKSSGAEERKTILAGVGELQGPAAVQLAAGYLADEALKAEAALTVVQIVRRNGKAFPDAAADALGQVQFATVDENLKKEAAALQATLKPAKGK